MKNERDPFGTFMALTTLVIIGASSRHCMKKYSDRGEGRRRIGIKFIRRPWRIF